MAPTFIFYVFGYLEVRVTGSHLERFINLAVSRGIYFWDIRYRDDDIILKMGVQAFRRLRPLVRKAGCRVRILRRHGLPFLLRRVSRRRLLAAVVGVVGLAIYLSSSFVWVVEIKGLKELPESRLVKTLAELGLRPGVTKNGVDLEKVANELPLRVHEVAWVGIYLEGAKVVVEVVEKERLSEKDRPIQTPGDLVATKDGLVTHLITLQGEPAVSEGDMVRRGQILIRGVTQLQEEGGSKEEKKGTVGPRPVRARGIVRARVWYDTYIEMPLEKETAVRTGRVHSRRMVRFLERDLVFSGWREPPFADYQVDEIRLRPPRWRNAVVPVEFIHLRFSEVVRRSERISRNEAVTRAEAEAKRRLLEQIPLEARILRENVLVVQDSGKLIGLKLVIETEETIGRLEESRTGTPAPEPRRRR